MPTQSENIGMFLWSYNNLNRVVCILAWWNWAFQLAPVMAMARGLPKVDTLLSVRLFIYVVSSGFIFFFSNIKKETILERRNALLSSIEEKSRQNSLVCWLVRGIVIHIENSSSKFTSATHDFMTTEVLRCQHAQSRWTSINKMMSFRFAFEISSTFKSL